MYLGEKEVDVKDTLYKDYSASDWAILWIEKYGQYDGGHHKQWVMDQVVRILKGGTVTVKVASWDDHPDEYRFSVEPSEEYFEWVEGMEGDPESDEYCEYDEGIAP